LINKTYYLKRLLSGYTRWIAAFRFIVLSRDLIVCSDKVLNAKIQ
jgi:hypothetical protein